MDLDYIGLEKSKLTGPEYAQRFIDEVEKRDIDVLLGHHSYGYYRK